MLKKIPLLGGCFDSDWGRIRTTGQPLK